MSRIRDFFTVLRSNAAYLSGGIASASYKKLAVALMTLAITTGCESPFMHKNEVSTGFHPGLSMDLNKATVQTSAATVVSGNSVGVVVKITDQNGNAWIDNRTNVSIAFSGGESTGTLSNIVSNKDGTYSATLTGQRAGSASTVSAIVNGVPVTVSLPKVTVLPGPLSLDHSALTASAPKVSAGSSVNLLFVLRDKESNPIGKSGAGLNVSFSYAGSSEGTFGPVTDNGDGSYGCTFTGTVAGDPSDFVAKVQERPAGAKLPHVFVQVIAGSPTSGSSVLTVSATQVISGNSVTLRLVSRDEYGNSAGNGRLVTFSAVGGTSTGSISATTAGENGSYTASFTGIVAGTPTTIHAQIDGQEVVTTLPQVAVLPGPPNAVRSVITASASIVPSGSTANLYLTLKDINGNVADSSSASVSFFFAGGTSTGIVGSASYQGNAVYAATFTGLKAGTAGQVGATLNSAVAGGGANPLIVVIPGPFSPIQSLIGVSSPTVNVFNTVQLSLTAKDAFGNLINNGGLSVSFNYGGGTGTGTIGPVSDSGNGVYVATFTATGAGTPVSIGASASMVPVLSASPTLTINPPVLSLSNSTIAATPSSVVSGNQSTLSLTLRDPNGNQIKDGALSVAFTASGGTSTGVISSATYNSSTGIYSATFTGVLAGTPTQIRATVGGSAVTSASPSVTVTPGAFSLLTSTITVPANTVVSGASLPVSITLRDSQGNLVSNGSVAVAVSNSGGTSQGTFGPVSYSGNGVYTSQFVGTIAGTPTTFGATLNGGALSDGPAVTVTAGSFSLAQSSITVSPSTVQAGSQATITLVLKDASGNVVSLGGQLVNFNQSIAGMGQIGSVTDHGDGTYSATFTGLVAGGPDMISARINSSAITSAPAPVSVTAGPMSLADSTISVPSSSVPAGSSVSVSVTPKDAYGNIINNNSYTIVYIYSGGTSQGTFGTPVYSGGTYSAPFTGTVAGTPILLGATINGSPITSTGPGISVVPGAFSLAQSTISVSPSSIQAGSQATITLTAKDAQGNTLSAGGLSIAFNQSIAGMGTIGSVTDHGNGTYSAPFTGVIAGGPDLIGATINAGTTGGAVTSPSAPISVTPGALSLSGSVVTVSSNQVNAGSSITVSITPKDAYGNLINNESLAIGASNQGGTSQGTFGSVTYLNGVYSVSFTGTVAGSATQIIATIGGQSVTSTAPSVTVNPGAMSLAQSLVSVSAPSVASGSSVTVSLTPKDSFGNTVVQSGLTVVFAASGGTSTGSLSAVSFNSSSGVYSSSFTGVLAGTATGLGATVNSSAVTSSLPTITVIPGGYSLAQSTISASPSSVQSGSSATLTLVSKDAAGNLLASGGLNVAFTQSIANMGQIGAVTDLGNGSYTAQFTGIVAGGPDLIGASINAGSGAGLGGGAVTSASAPMTVTPGAFSLANSIVTVPVSTLAAGSSVTVSIVPKDINGNPVNLSNLTIGFSFSGGTSSGTWGTVSYLNGVYSVSFLGTTAGTPISLTASINGQPITSASPSLTILPGPYDLAQSEISASTNSVVTGSAISVSLALKDSYGNAVNQSGLSVAFSYSGGTSTGTFSTTSFNSSSGIYSANFTGVLAGSATSIGASVGGVAVSSAKPSVSVVAGSYQLANTVVSVSSASVVSGSSVVVSVTPKDASGNVVVQSGLTIVLSANGGTSTGNFGSVSYNSSTGVYSATFTGVLAGSATTIGASINGAAVTSALPGVTVTPGAYSLTQSQVSTSAGAVASGSSVVFTLTLRDAAGNSVGSAGNGLTVAFNTSGGTSTGTQGSVSNSGAGIYTAQFTGVLAGTALTIGASVNSSPVTSSLPSVTVIPGAFSLAQSVVSVSASTVSSGGAVTVQLIAKDAQGNQLSSGGLNIVFTQSISGMGQFGTVVDSGNGIYTASFTGIIAGGPDLLNATINGSSLTHSPASISVTPGALSLANSTLTSNVSSVGVGGAAALTVTLKDSNGNLLTQGGATISFAILSGSSTGSFSSANDNSNGTYSATFTGTAAGTAAVIRASANGSAISTTVSISVTSGGINLEVPIEMIDSPIASKSGTHTWNVSRTNLNTNFYDGTVSYFFEVVASNYTSSAKNVKLLNSQGTVIATIAVSGNVSQNRLRTGFTPTVGQDTYRISIEGANSDYVVVHTARILVDQVGATKTRIYVPLLVNDHNKINRRSCQWVDYNSGSNYSQGVGSNGYRIWHKNLSKLSSLAASNPWTFDAVVWKDHGTEDNDSDDDDDNIPSGTSNSCYASLFNANNNTQVTASAVGTLSGSPALLSSSFSDSTSGFSDQAPYWVKLSGPSGDGGRCYLGKAGIWVALTNLTHAEIAYRVQKGYWGGASWFDYSYWAGSYWFANNYWGVQDTGVDASSRILLDLSKFPAGAQTYYEIAAKISSNATVSVGPYDHGTQDSGASGASAVSGCQVTQSNLSTSWSLYRTPACTMQSGDRFVNGMTASSGVLLSSGSYIVVSF